jgi:DNA-binding IclR family transcriptional regulator
MAPTGVRWGTLTDPEHRRPDVITARDRPPEEAAEDTSFARGLKVFLTIADRGEIRADELATLLETPLSTIYRYLRTLTEFGFVDRHDAGYRLGPRLHVLGDGPTVSAEELIRAADPVLTDLAAMTGETAFVSRRIGLGAVILAERPSDQPVRVVAATGSPGPLHIGAVGLVLLAYAPAEIREAALADVPTSGAIERMLAGVVDEGRAEDHGVTFPGAVTLAVPVLRDDGIVAAIGLSAPFERARRRWRTRAGTSLRRAATALAEALRPDSPG